MQGDGTPNLSVEVELTNYRLIGAKHVGFRDKQDTCARTSTRKQCTMAEWNRPRLMRFKPSVERRLVPKTYLTVSLLHVPGLGRPSVLARIDVPGTEFWTGDTTEKSRWKRPARASEAMRAELE